MPQTSIPISDVHNPVLLIWVPRSGARTTDDFKNLCYDKHRILLKKNKAIKNCVFEKKKIDEVSLIFSQYSISLHFL